MIKDVEALTRRGAAVAHVMREGDQRESGRHLPVSDQVLGYLRWYDDLRDLPGYWPLAEAIALTIEVEGRFPEELRRLISQFAQEWEITAKTVRVHMVKVIERAIQAHPDFASQVMGSLRDPYVLSPRMFLIHSHWWLSCHHLCIIPCEPGLSFAVWNLSSRYQEKFWRSEPYLTQLDYRIIAGRGRGVSFEALAEELSLPAEEAETDYDAAVSRVYALAGILGLETPRIQKKDIRGALKTIGILPAMEGAAELVAAVQMVREDPRLLDRMSLLLEKVGGQMGQRPVTAAAHMNHLLQRARSNSRRTGAFADFYRPLTGRVFTIRTFIPAFLKYMES